jgi:hypothetical protein
MIFLDTAEEARRLHVDAKKIFGRAAKDIAAFHHFNGQPIALVFVKTVLAGPGRLRPRDKISMAASHELAEMLVDPGNNLWCEFRREFYAYEVCDAVEAKHFPVQGLAMSNFVYPAYFEIFRKPRSAQFDHMKLVNRPLQILEDGYAPVKKAGRLRLRLRSSPMKTRQLHEEDRDLHRSEFRRKS